MIKTPDELLAQTLADCVAWERAPSGSREENEAAERATSGIMTLDYHLRHGGDLPRAWLARAAPGTGTYEVIVADTEASEPRTVTGSQNLMGGQEYEDIRFAPGIEPGCEPACIPPGQHVSGCPNQPASQKQFNADQQARHAPPGYEPPETGELASRRRRLLGRW
jgi:hypothetical protein